MPNGKEVRSVSQQNVSPSAQGLEVKELSSGHGRSVSLDIPLYRTGDSVSYALPMVNECYGDVTPTIAGQLVPGNQNPIEGRVLE
jgi:hypothetical protein